MGGYLPWTGGGTYLKWGYLPWMGGKYLDGGTLPRPGMDGSTPLLGLDGGTPREETAEEHLKHGGRYASCVHAGGFFCLILILVLPCRTVQLSTFQLQVFTVCFICRT